MRIDLPLCLSNFDRISKELGVAITSAPAELLEWLRMHRVPEELVELFQTGWPESSLWWGTIYLQPSPDFVSWNSTHEGAVNNGFLIVGGASNGDPLVIDFLTGSGKVGFLNHDEFWLGVDARSVFFPFAETFGGFLENITQGKEIPFDAYEAKEWIEAQSGRAS